MLSRQSLRGADSERGFTLVEVIMAVLIITVATLALIDALVASGRLTHGSQRQAQAIAYAQGTIEKIRSLPWNNIALSSSPTHQGTGTTVSGDKAPAKPDYYVSASGTQFQVLDNWRDDTSTSGPGWETLKVDGTNGLVPATTTIPSSTGISGTIHYYVTQVPGLNASDPVGGLVGTLSGNNQRRITVAITLESVKSVGPIKPIWLTSTVSNPYTCPLGLVLSVLPPPLTSC